jgi:hypothetical protein
MSCKFFVIVKPVTTTETTLYMSKNNFKSKFEIVLTHA